MKIEKLFFFSLKTVDIVMKMYGMFYLRFSAALHTAPRGCAKVKINVFKF